MVNRGDEEVPTQTVASVPLLDCDLLLGQENTEQVSTIITGCW